MLKNVAAKNRSGSQYSKTGIHVLLVGIAMLTLGQSTGCKLGIKEASMLTYRDTVWSKRAFNLRYGNCEREYSEHFQNGFCAGYVATCNGGDGYVPALPPSEYRSPGYQSADGAKCVNSWFEGYPAGVAAAKKDKSGTYHDVLISRMINSAVSQSKTQPVLPGDVKVISGSQANDSGIQANVYSNNNASRSQIPVVRPPFPGGNPPNWNQGASTNPTHSILTPATMEAPPQASSEPNQAPPIKVSPMDPTDYSASLPGSSDSGAAESVAESVAESAGFDQPILNPEDIASNPTGTLYPPVEIAPVNWTESPK